MRQPKEVDVVPRKSAVVRPAKNQELDSNTRDCGGPKTRDSLSEKDEINVPMALSASRDGDRSPRSGGGIGTISLSFGA